MNIVAQNTKWDYEEYFRTFRDAKNKDQEASQAKMWFLAIILPIVLPILSATAFNSCQRSLKARSIHLQQLSKRSRHVIFPPANDSTSTINACGPLFARSDNGGDGASKATIYKDDCFGFTTFVAGFAVQDYVFTGIFVTLSLIGDVLTRVDILPPDPKRPYIVDRRVPGVVAVLTLILRYAIADIIVDVETFSVGDMDVDLARYVQLAFCSFSFATAFLDIRWRDRFDYPDDPV